MLININQFENRCLSRQVIANIVGEKMSVSLYHQQMHNRQILYEMCFNLKLSGNEVDCTIFLILLVKIMLCSTLHSQEVLD